MVFDLYRQLIKEELEYNQSVNQMPRGDALEIAFKQLSILDNGVINGQIKNYRDKKEALVKEYNEINEKLNKLVDEYYTELMKKL